MKKLTITLFLFFITAGLSFAFSSFVDDDDFSNKSFLVNVGDTYYTTERLSDFSLPRNIELHSNSFAMELGIFTSDEDGLIDFVSSDVLGFGWGKVNSEGLAFYNDSHAFNIEEDANHFNIYGKNTFGLQINLFAFSLGATVGPKYGFDRMSQTSIYNGSHSYSYAENRIFMDFAVAPYVSVNILHFVKIFFTSEFDYPIFRVRFIDSDDGPVRSEGNIKWDWFKNDVPITYMIGAALFF